MMFRKSSSKLIYETQIKETVLSISFLPVFFLPIFNILKMFQNLFKVDCWKAPEKQKSRSLSFSRYNFCESYLLCNYTTKNIISPSIYSHIACIYPENIR